MEKRLLKVQVIILLLFLFASCSAFEPGMSVLMGNYSYQVGEFQQATVNYVKGLESRKFKEWIYYNMGNVYFSLGEGGAALEVWANVESTEDPELRHRLHFNKGVLFYQLRRYGEAYDMFREALIADPGSIDAKINLELTLGKLAAPVAEEENHNRSGGDVNPGETQRMLEYIRRKEGELWYSTDVDENINQEDW